MPNPDGRIRSQDVCTEAVVSRTIGAAAVVTRTIGADAVTTEKIANLAVGTAQIDDLAVDTAQINTAAVTKLKVGDQEIDIQRMLNPIGWDRDHDSVTNVALTTTWESLVTNTVTVPSYAGSVLQSVAGLSHVNGSGASLVGASVVLSDSTSDPAGHISQTIRNGEEDTWTEIDSAIVSSPGATVVSQLWGRILSGTTSQGANAFILDMQCLFKR